MGMAACSSKQDKEENGGQENNGRQGTSVVGDAVSLLFRDAFRDVQWEKQIAARGYLFIKEDGFVVLARKGEGREINFYNAQGE